MSTNVYTAEQNRGRQLAEDDSQDVTLDEPLASSASKRPASLQDWEKLKQEVRARSRLEDVIDASWEKRTSEDWWCSSPLRPGQDSTPSFHINPERQVWKDFGLDGRGGDVFAYLQRMWNCSFVEALKRRAAELNIPLPSSALLTEAEQAQVDERELVETVLTIAAECYHESLPAELRTYLNEHYAFTDTTIDALKIGFDDGTLYDKLKREGYSDYEMALTGLFGNAEKDNTRFAGRITFPYWRGGRVVYFAARQTRHTPAFIKDDKDVAPKYLKLKTGPTGDALSWVSRTVTNDHFWGEDCAGRRLDVLLIAEGMPDAISAHQAGFNVISPVTVQFRDKDNAKLLALTKNVKRLILIPDQESNGAGMKGASKTCTFLCQHGRDARILVLPHATEKAAAEAKAEQLRASGSPEPEIKSAANWKVDLNEWMRGRTPDDLQQLLDSTPSHIQSMIKALPEDLDPEGREAALKPIMRLIAAKPASTRDVFVDLVKSRVGGTKKALATLLVEQLAEVTEAAPAGKDVAQVHGGFALTDMGNASRLHALAGKIVRYVPEWKSFIVFTGKHWLLDHGGHLVRRVAGKMVKHELAAATKIEDSEARQAVIAHWTRCQSRRTLDNMVELLKDQRGACIEPRQLDQHPYLLNLRNGTLDLKRRELRDHDPADLLTKVVDHRYEPAAECPNFMRYLEAAQPDPEVRDWLHRRDGSSLTADCSDQIFVVHHGAGGSGKGTRYRVLKHVLGDYVVKAPRSVFEAQRYRQHPADLMTLAGRRLAYGSEISPYLNVDQIKELTGEEDFQARGMGENFSEQRGNCKLEVMMNKAPIIREDPDDGIWRRLRIVPWSVKFEGEQRDNRLFDRLKDEAEGILAWLVQGCYKWIDEGLTEPSAIMHATEEFAAEQDHITPFLDEVCDRSDPDAIVLAEELFKARQEWNASRNERPNESQKAFGDALKARGLRHGPDDPRTRRTRWKGIKLRNLHRLHSLPMESPGLCVTTDEENTEIRNILGGDQEAEDARREFHRLMLAV